MSAFEVIIVLLVFEAISFLKFLYFKKNFHGAILPTEAKGPQPSKVDEQMEELLAYDPLKNILKRGSDA